MKKVLYSLLAILIGSAAFGQVFSFRGPEHTGKFAATGLLKSWPAEGPKMILSVDGIGKGYSSPVFDGENIYTTGMIDSLDYLSCIDMQGNIKWKVSYGHSWRKSFPDTRGSATIEGDRVYVLSGVGELSCINKKDGTTLWKVDVDKDFQSEWHMWGVAETPLIVDDKVICSPGGKKTSVVAFDKMTGKLKWESACVGGQRSYVSPTIYTYKNFRFILAATANNLIALVPETGKVVWSYDYYKEGDWTYQPGLIWANTPIFKGDEIFISKGYDFPNVMLKMKADGSGVEKKWNNTVLDNHHHGVVEVDGKIYGSNWISNGKGKWVCLDWETGKVEYEVDWNNKGSMVFADGLLYVYEEKGGNVGLVKPDPSGFQVVSSFKVDKGTGPHWAHLFIADGKMFLRHGDVLMVYDIKA